PTPCPYTTLFRSDVRLHCARAELGRERLGLVLTRAKSEDDLRASLREVGRDGAPDSARGPGDERPLALQRCEAHVSASVSCSLSSAARLFTETALTLRSIRFTRPERTLPGPTSTNVFTPSRISS